MPVSQYPAPRCPGPEHLQCYCCSWNRNARLGKQLGKQLGSTCPSSKTQKKNCPSINHMLHDFTQSTLIMAALPQVAPPVLSTPETHIFEDPAPPPPPPEARLTNAEIRSVYEIERTVREIHDGGWRTIALQFPDGMLCDSPRIFEALEQDLAKLSAAAGNADLVPKKNTEELETNFNELVVKDPPQDASRRRYKLYILADTSYGSCCVDEIAAEHVDADVIIHYGRSCLSPTARVPVIYVFTSRPLPLEPFIETFEATYGEQGNEQKIMLMADITYHSHIPEIREKLVQKGWQTILVPEIIQDPSSLIPNRNISALKISEQELLDYSLFHISDPPPALLLTLSSRVKDLHIYPTKVAASSGPTKVIQLNTAQALRRRYALLTSLSTCAIFGILINTLSVRNYLETVTHIKRMIEQAGKKSYTFVVGKVNAAKIANFSEIGGWVVIGCWESSLIESTEFYRPIITPFELQMALKGDEERIWTGQWRGDFENLNLGLVPSRENVVTGEGYSDEQKQNELDEDSEEESAPPEFDLRTGRYVSHTRPMKTTVISPSAQNSNAEKVASNTLVRRAIGDLATVNGTVSPGAEYLRSQRTWTGLGSDFHEVEASTTIEEGRGGIARGYTTEGVDER
jgi:diphthamide biosynthesis protein 2